MDEILIWAGVVAAGVAIVSMTAFATWLTRQTPPDPDADDFIPSADPDDPWAAYRPRPFEDLQRRRPRTWPVIVGLMGLVVTGGGIAGARQAVAPQAIEVTDASPRPYMIEVEPDGPLAPVSTEEEPEAAAQEAEAPASTSAPAAASEPTPAPATPAPATPAPEASASTSSSEPPTVTASASCSGGTLEVSYSVAAGGPDLSWVTLYVDGEAVRGGPISGRSHSSTYTAEAASGDHPVEVSADDRDGGHAAKRLSVHCP